MKLRIRASFFCDEIQKIPLGHQTDEFAMRRQVGKIRDYHGGIVDYAGDGSELLVRAPQEVFKYSKLIHQFECGRVDGVASEITEEIGVFFEDLDIDTGAGEQEA
jgi:hypothetical protein